LPNIMLTSNDGIHGKTQEHSEKRTSKLRINNIKQYLLVYRPEPKLTSNAVQIIMANRPTRMNLQ